MNRTQHEGIKFGFTFLMIWLLLLTGYLMYDKMNVRFKPMVLQPIPVMELEPLPIVIEED